MLEERHSYYRRSPLSLAEPSSHFRKLPLGPGVLNSRCPTIQRVPAAQSSHSQRTLQVPVERNSHFPRTPQVPAARNNRCQAASCCLLRLLQTDCSPVPAAAGCCSACAVRGPGSGRRSRGTGCPDRRSCPSSPLSSERSPYPVPRPVISPAPDPFSAALSSHPCVAAASFPDHCPDRQIYRWSAGAAAGRALRPPQSGRASPSYDTCKTTEEMGSDSDWLQSRSQSQDRRHFPPYLPHRCLQRPLSSSSQLRRLLRRRAFSPQRTRFHGLSSRTCRRG